MIFKIILLANLLIFTISCNKTNNSVDSKYTDPIKYYKDYWPNESGNLDSTEMAIHDFASASECFDCHGQYFSEWSKSRHAHSFDDPIFKKGWDEAQIDFPDTGERFCIQCHAPIAFVTGENDIYDVMKEGVTCTFCHSFTGFGETVNANDQIVANAIYKLNPGENTMYGPIENPDDNPYHNSEYSRLFSRSDMCLPCHDFTIGGIETEITFTEWNIATAGGMSETNSCQSCHMPFRNGRHEHNFIGVDIDLTKPIDHIDSQYLKVDSLLKTSVELSFVFDTNMTELMNNDTLTIPISVKSRIHHSLPSGTSFAREAWIEIKVLQNNSVVFSSGNLGNNTSDLNLNDPTLLLFTSNILSSNNDTLSSIPNTQYYFPQLLPALTTKDWTYLFIDDGGILDNSNPIDISVRMLFRPFKPAILRNINPPELLDNLPIFEMARIDTTYIIP